MAERSPASAREQGLHSADKPARAGNTCFRCVLSFLCVITRFLCVSHLVFQAFFSLFSVIFPCFLCVFLFSIRCQPLAGRSLCFFSCVRPSRCRPAHGGERAGHQSHGLSRRRVDRDAAHAPPRLRVGNLKLAMERAGGVGRGARPGPTMGWRGVQAGHD